MFLVFVQNHLFQDDIFIQTERQRKLIKSSLPFFKWEMCYFLHKNFYPWRQSPQNVGILGSRIPRKVLESEEGLSSKANELASRADESALKATPEALKEPLDNN